MNQDIEKLQRMLEQATAAENDATQSLDPETASLREAWVGFGRLLDAADMSSPLLLGEGQGVRAVPRPRRRLLPTAALLAASLLVGIATAWMFKSSERFVSPAGSSDQTAQVDAENSPPAEQPQWDDSFDEQIAQLGEQIACVQQGSCLWADDSGRFQHRLEQLQLDLERNGL